MIPQRVLDVCGRLRQAGFRAYVVGGAVRDTILGRPVKDWDIATDAHAETVLELFEGAHATGLKYGTVKVVHDGWTIEVTTFRRDGPYGDRRHPSYVEFVSTIEEDLGRRDFTMNALAYDPDGGRLIDPFGGREDIRSAVVRAVGDPQERLKEDALRMLRAVRFGSELGFALDPALLAAFCPSWLKGISHERIRDEFSAIVLSERVAEGLRTLNQTGLLEQFVPELAAGDIAQNEYHSLSVLDHCLAAAAGVPPVLHLRLAALLHDVGKPLSRSIGRDGRVHFYRHERIGALMAAQILDRLRYPKKLSGRVAALIAGHMSALRPEASDKVLRRIISRVGIENIDDLIALKAADHRAGKRGQPPLDTNELTRRIRRILARGDALSLGQLAIDGRKVKEVTGLPAGPEIGRILRLLLSRVIEDPSVNNPGTLALLAEAAAAQLDKKNARRSGRESTGHYDV